MVCVRDSVKKNIYIIKTNDNNKGEVSNQLND